MGSMWFFSIFTCMGPAVLLGILAFSIRTLWITLVPPKNMPREAGCGRCGYAVAGLTQHTCPECGADWRVAGITTPALIMRYRGGTFGAILAWTMLMGVLGLSVVSIGSIFVGRQMVTAMTTTPQTWTTPLTPASGAYTNVDFLSKVVMGARGAGTPDITLELTLTNGDVWKLTVDSSTSSAEITDPAIPNTPTALKYAPGATAAFYRAAGLSLSDAKIAAEATELEKMVDILIMSPYTQPSQMNLSNFTAGPVSFSGASAVASSFSPGNGPIITAFVVGILGLALYIGGIVFIVVRRGRLMGRYVSQTVYSPGM